MINRAVGQEDLINCETLYKKSKKAIRLKNSIDNTMKYCAFIKNHYTMFQKRLKKCASCEILYNKKEC